MKKIDPLLNVQRKYMNITILNSFIFTDPDAKAFLDVARPYDNTLNEVAIQNFVQEYRAAHSGALLASIGDTAIYLMYGGTETACCLNLINPSLTNAFNLVKFGSPIFGANGITTTGTQYLKTGIIPSSHTLLNNASAMFYNRHTTLPSSVYPYGCSSSTVIWGVVFQATCFCRMYNTTTATVGATIPGAGGLFIQNRTSSTYHKIFQKGAQVGFSSSSHTSTRPTTEMYLFCVNGNGVATGHYNTNMSYAAIAKGKTDQQCIDITNAVNRLQTALGRAV